MKLSAQDEYGLRCLLRLGRREEGGGLTIPEISQQEGISVANVGKLLRILRQGGFVESERGQRGGYYLTRSPRQIVIGEVLACLGGRLYEPDFCEHFAGAADVCTHSSVDCSVRALWMRVQGAVDQVLSQTTLEDLLSSGRQIESELLQVGGNPVPEKANS